MDEVPTIFVMGSTAHATTKRTETVFTYTAPLPETSNDGIRKLDALLVANCLEVNLKKALTLIFCSPLY